MENLKALLENHFIYKEANRELYYSIYDSQKEFRPFLAKLGFQLIIRNDFLRLEKFPFNVDEFMGIQNFTTIEEYIFFMLLLVFLEDKGKDYQFLLGDIIEVFETNGKIPVDTTIQRTRRQICKVLNFATENYIILLCGGNIDSYVTDRQTQVLYDNTGISKYFMRNFSIELNNCNNFDDLLTLVTPSIDTPSIENDITTTKQNIAYRDLLLRPVVYNKESLYNEYEYIKRFRTGIGEDFEKYLGWSLHVQKELATVVPQDNDKITDVFPTKGGINTAILLFNLEIRNKVYNNFLIVDKSGNINLTRNQFFEIAAHVKETKGKGFIQSLRNMNQDRFAEELIFHLRKFMMCDDNGDNIILLPAIGKIVGDYPKSFYDTLGGKQ